jgi:hypothetical protein
MRIPALLSALAVASLILFVPASTAQSSPSQHKAALGLSDPGAILRINGDSPGDDSTLYGKANKLAERNFCLKLRTYVVARDASQSDSTHLVGYTDCQPAARYDLHSTDKRDPQLHEGTAP